jgi:hypothetical protein
VRGGSIAAADRLLTWLESSVSEDIRLSVARARLLEWCRRDPQAAIAVVEAAQLRMPEEAPALESRLARLRRKAGKRTGSDQTLF